MGSEKVNFKKVRRLKVYPKQRSGTTGYKIVPEIRLCGKWLSEVGFKAGDFIEIVSEMNKITITVVENELNCKSSLVADTTIR